MRNKNQFIFIFIFGVVGYISGSILNYVDIGSKAATITVPYFDLLVDDGKYSFSTKKDFLVLSKKQSPQFQMVSERINARNSSSVNEAIFNNLIISARVDSNNGIINLAIPFYNFITLDSFKIYVDAIVLYLNEVSASKYKKLNIILDLKKTIIAQSKPHLKYNTQSAKNSLSVSDYQDLLLQISELENILQNYEPNQYYVTYGSDNSPLSPSVLSFKFVFLFILLGALLAFKSLREGCISLIFGDRKF